MRLGFAQVWSELLRAAGFRHQGQLHGRPGAGDTTATADNTVFLFRNHTVPDTT